MPLVAFANATFRQIDVSENGGFPPQIIHFNRVFHHFHHPFWGTPILGNPQFFFAGQDQRIAVEIGPVEPQKLQFLLSEF